MVFELCGLNLYLYLQGIEGTPGLPGPTGPEGPRVSIYNMTTKYFVLYSCHGFPLYCIFIVSSETLITTF